MLNAKTKLYISTPLRLSPRIISIAERPNKFEEYFKYELTQEPTSLLKDRFVHNSHKSDLKNSLIENAHKFQIYPASKIVVDGGALLHQVSWTKIYFYSEVIDQYSDYLQNNYGL